MTFFRFSFCGAKQRSRIFPLIAMAVAVSSYIRKQHTCLGILVHTYKEPTMLRSAILCEVRLEYHVLGNKSSRLSLPLPPSCRGVCYHLRLALSSGLHCDGETSRPEQFVTFFWCCIYGERTTGIYVGICFFVFFIIGYCHILFVLTLTIWTLRRLCLGCVFWLPA